MLATENCSCTVCGGSSSSTGWASLTVGARASREAGVDRGRWRAPTSFIDDDIDDAERESPQWCAADLTRCLGHQQAGGPARASAGRARCSSRPRPAGRRPVRAAHRRTSVWPRVVRSRPPAQREPRVSRLELLAQLLPGDTGCRPCLDAGQPTAELGAPLRGDHVGSVGIVQGGDETVGEFSTLTLRQGQCGLEDVTGRSQSTASQCPSAETLRS